MKTLLTIAAASIFATSTAVSANWDMPFFGDNNGYNSNNSNWNNNSNLNTSREGEFDSSFSFGMKVKAKGRGNGNYDGQNGYNSYSGYNNAPYGYVPAP